MTAEFRKLYADADAAGNEAVAKLNVVPMVVGTAVGFSNEIDYTKPTYYVEDGVCGFAWVNVKPGTSRFARWLKNERLARTDSYYGGVTIWVSKFNQSYQKKYAYATAFAETLAKAGIRCYASGRLD